MTNAIHRTPCLETAEIKMLLNGPESFTPDGNFILGEAPELRNYFVCAGFNSAGIANSGGAGRLIAEWIVGGEPSTDLWDVDIRRLAPSPATARPCSSARAKHWACTMPCAGHARSWKPRGHCAPRRCTTRCRPRARSSAARTAGSAPTTSARRRAAPGLHAGHPRLAALDAGRAACHARRCSLYDQSRSPSCCLQGRDALASCSACAPTRWTCP
jgi:hypothetical protein